jgi:hypothetical protein
MKAIDIEKLNQLISRTDISGNDKVRWLTDFIDGREFQQQEQDKKLYSEEEVGELVYNIIGEYAKQYGIMIDGDKLNDLFRQFKNK